MILSSKSLRKRIKELESSVKALRVNEEKFRQIWDYAPDAIFITKIGGKDSGKILDANPAATRQTGYSIEELIGMNIVARLPSDKEAIGLANEREKALMQGDQILFSEKKKRKDRSEYWTEVHIRNIKVGGEYMALAINRDITQWKIAEEALRVSEEKYRLNFEYSPLGLLSFDEKGVIVACNNNFVKIIGSSQEALIGLNMLNLPDKNIVSSVKKALSGSLGFYEGPYSSLTAKKITPVRCIFTTISVGDGKFHGGLGIIEDITDRKYAEEEILKLKDALEVQVVEKTKDLNEKMSDLQKFFDASVDRELRMKELFDENLALRAKLERKEKTD